MNSNRIDAEIPIQTLNQASEMVNELNQLIGPFLLTQTSDDILTGFAKIGSKTESFVAKALEHAMQQSQLVPEFACLEQAQTDFKLYQDLKDLEDLLWRLLNKIAQTRTLAGAEALDFAQDFYKYTGMLSKNNELSASKVHQDLSARYQRKSFKQNRQTA